MRRIVNVLLGLTIGIASVVCLSHFLQAGRARAQASDPSQVVDAAIGYLHSQQQADGGITGFSGASDPDTTARTVLALVAAGEPITGFVSSSGQTMIDYLAGQAISFTHDITGAFFPGRGGELLAATSLTGQPPDSFGGVDLAGDIEASFQADTGTYSSTAKQDYSSGQASDLNQAWALLGLSLAGKEVPQAATNYLLGSQAADGSWGFGDPDTTALAAVALLSSNNVTPQDEVIQNALNFFHATQAESGGWKPSWDTDPLNADSTGWILQALLAAGEDPTSDSWTINGINPVDALIGLHKPDGSIGGTYANTYSTAEAVLGLSGKALSTSAQSPESNRAGLAVFPGDGSVYTACVSFTESSISGLDLLERSGLPLQTATNPNQGTAVCKIGNTGCPADDCFCNMPDYWSYWQSGDNGWAYAVTGAEQSSVTNGDANAWSWGKGDSPALITFQNICEGVPFSLPAATQTSLPVTHVPPPTEAPQPTQATATEQPTNTIQATPAAVGSKTQPGMYLVYASILVVLAVLIVYPLRFRSR